MTWRKLVLIEWEDAHSDLNEYSESDIKDTGPVITHSAGFFVEANEHGVVYCEDYWPEDEKLKNEIRGRHFVGWGMIQNWYILEL